MYFHRGNSQDDGLWWGVSRELQVQYLWETAAQLQHTKIGFSHQLSEPLQAELIKKSRRSVSCQNKEQKET